MTSSAPLAGIRVLTMAEQLPGPYAMLLLAESGMFAAFGDISRSPPGLGEHTEEVLSSLPPKGAS